MISPKINGTKTMEVISMRVIRVGKIDEATFPFTRKTLYRWHLLNRYPGIFITPEGSNALLLDLDAFERIVLEPGRGRKATRNRKSAWKKAQEANI